MSESSPEQGPEQSFGAPPGSAQWPPAGFSAPPAMAPPTAAATPASDQGFNPQPYGDQYPAQQPYPQQPYYPAQGYPPQGGYQPYPPGYAQTAYAGYAPTAASFPRSTAALLAVSVLAAIATGIIGIPSATVAALAWRRNGTDPAAAAKRTTTGWIVFGVNFAIGILLLIPFYIWASNNQ